MGRRCYRFKRERRFRGCPSSEITGRGALCPTGGRAVRWEARGGGCNRSDMRRPSTTGKGIREKREMSMSTRSNVKRETRTSCPVWLVSCEVRRPRWEQELKDSPYAPRTWCPDQKQASTKRQVLIFYDLYEPLPVGWIAGREALVEFPWPKSGHLPGAAVAPQGQLPADKLGHPPRMPFSICAI